MAKNKVKSGLADIISGMKKDANAGSAWHVKRIAQLEAMLAAETGIEPTAAPEATAAPTIASVATTSLSAVIPPVSPASPVPPISATAAAGPTAAASATSAATTARNTAATAAILTSMSKEALAEIDRQKKLDTIKAKNKRDAEDKLLAAFEKGQEAIQDALGGRKERKDLGTRIEDKKKSFKEFFTLRGFLNSTGMVKKGGGSLIDDMLGTREDKSNYVKVQTTKAEADHNASGVKTPFDRAGIASAAEARFDANLSGDKESRRLDAKVKEMALHGEVPEQDLQNTQEYKDRESQANKNISRNASPLVSSRTPKVKAPSAFKKTMKSVSGNISKAGNVSTKNPTTFGGTSYNLAANMGTPGVPGGSLGSAISNGVKSIAGKPGSIGKSVMGSLGKTALGGIARAGAGMMAGPAMAGIAAAAGPALLAAAPFILGAAALGVVGYGAKKAYDSVTKSKIEGANDREDTQIVTDKVQGKTYDKLDAAMGKLPEAVKPTSASLIDNKSAENALAATEGKTAPNNVVVAPVTNNSVQNHPTTYKQLARNPDTTFTRHIDSRMSGAF